jgi:hypothetical protein
MISREDIAARIQALPPEQQAEAARLALLLYGAASGLSPAHKARAKKYQFDAVGYIRDVLGWEPWEGTEEEPGQIEVIRAYELALRQQFEREAYNRGDITAAELKWWKVGQAIENEIRVEAGHGVGKTKLASGLFSHFFDCFIPSIIYTFAPTEDQIRDLLWKEIGTDRQGNRAFPGVLTDLHIEISKNHFAQGRATNDNGGKGSERVQGQHGEFLMFILDEAEGVAGFVFNAIKTMLSGGIGIVLMLANPKTRVSDFYHARKRSTCKSFRISSHSHPNVVKGYDVIPGAVKRTYVESMMEGDGASPNVEIVRKHDHEKHTFTLPFAVSFGGEIRPPGTIFLPNDEYLFRVLGIPPESGAGNTLIPTGRFEAATKRKLAEVDFDDRFKVRMGVDVSRWGNDYGTLYVKHGARAWREGQFYGQDSNDYIGGIVECACRIYDEAPAGAKPISLHVRVDGTGGWGSGVIDSLRNNRALLDRFEDFKVIEVMFNGVTSKDNADKYDNMATEIYATAGLVLGGLCIERAPKNLEPDLCERTFKWITKGRGQGDGQTVKQLRDKDEFKKDHDRSPDDGDGFCLAVAPDSTFTHLIVKQGERKAKVVTFRR